MGFTLSSKLLFPTIVWHPSCIHIYTFATNGAFDAWTFRVTHDRRLLFLSSSHTIHSAHRSSYSAWTYYRIDCEMRGWNDNNDLLSD